MPICFFTFLEKICKPDIWHVFTVNQITENDWLIETNRLHKKLR